MSEQKVTLKAGDFVLDNPQVDFEKAVDTATRRYNNSYQTDTYPYGATSISGGYSNPNRIAMKNRVEVISAGLRFTLQEVTYFLNKSRAPGNTEVKIVDVYNPDKPDVLEGQRLVLEWTSV